LLYSYENCGSEALLAPFAAALATQATGRVRLQVTGNPPTINDFCFFSPAQDSKLEGRAAAIAPCRICLRRRKIADSGLSGLVGITLVGLETANLGSARPTAKLPREVYRKPPDVSLARGEVLHGGLRFYDRCI
jgi:hypothetical protein